MSGWTITLVTDEEDAKTPREALSNFLVSIRHGAEYNFELRPCDKPDADPIVLSNYPTQVSNELKLSNELKRLLMAEIDNEVEGGVSPTTLGSALDSVEQGYSPDLDDTMNMSAVESELRDLITEYSANTPAEDFITEQDWLERISNA